MEKEVTLYFERMEKFKIKRTLLLEYKFRIHIYIYDMIYLLTAIGLSPGGSKICDCILPQAEDD